MEGETIYVDLATLCEQTGLPNGEVRAAAKARAAGFEGFVPACDCLPLHELAGRKRIGAFLLRARNTDDRSRLTVALRRAAAVL